ncbi:MAG: SOS response-associated peptidase [Pseudomonadota bacterium]
MPGRLFLMRPLDEIAKWADADIGGITQPPRANIAPGQEIVVLHEGQLSLARWGIIPVGRKNARGRPVMETIINARSETGFDKAAFDGVGRAVIPCDGWYEWTGESRRKTAWRIQSKDGAPLAFAAITDRWNGPGGITMDQVAAVTCAPNGDVRDIHHRMGVLFEPRDIDTWLHAGPQEAARLLVPWPDGRLIVECADDVDWNGA